MQKQKAIEKACRLFAVMKGAATPGEEQATRNVLTVFLKAHNLQIQDLEDKGNPIPESEETTEPVFESGIAMTVRWTDHQGRKHTAGVRFSELYERMDARLKSEHRVGCSFGTFINV